ncbi:hypothetical protein [Deinococcus enclensis]|uniref:FlgD Ig-like domain-containing protein n=1 Tax=Deinococcus enclensis TaxID=1049582 RepID=A0ABT9MF18_9DEIO|nr:hypothetical protein [Deinococcus enclensis]MDP9765180.1 hypothetical protein [Deinococcus enclensis]
MALATSSIPALPPSRIQLSTEYVQAERQAFDRLRSLQFEQVAPAIVGGLPLAFTLTVTLPRQPGQGVLLQATVRNRSDQPVRWKVVPPGPPDFGILDAQGAVVWICREYQSYREGRWRTLAARDERQSSCLWRGLNRDGQSMPPGRYYVAAVINSSDPRRPYGYKSEVWSFCLPDASRRPSCPTVALPEVLRR